MLGRSTAFFTLREQRSLRSAVFTLRELPSLRAYPEVRQVCVGAVRQAVSFASEKVKILPTLKVAGEPALNYSWDMRFFRPLAFVAATLALLTLAGAFLRIDYLIYVASTLAALTALAAGVIGRGRGGSGLEKSALPDSKKLPAEAETSGFDLAPADEGPAAPPPPDLSPLDDARRRLAFAHAIASSVPAITEEAAFALIERFESMRSNTSRAATSAREFKKTMASGVGSSHAPVADQAEKTRQVIKNQRSAIADMASHNKQGAKDLRAMGKELESGMDLLKGIEEITERSRLIAFNMAVEAARIGEKGRGFKVIVGELRKLNDRTADFSHQVVELLGRFRDYNASIVARLAEETERVAHQVQGGMDASEGAVESLIAASGSADNFAREIASLAEVIDGDLDGVLESLQFQDITRQMIEGSMEILEEAETDLGKVAELSGRPANPKKESGKLEELRKTLYGRSKTKGEKDAIMEVKA